MKRQKLSIPAYTSWLMGVDPVATGNMLRSRRVASHLTQEDLSELFERGGDSASRVTISNWETGRKLPTLMHVVFLSELYSCSLDELVVSYRRSQDAEESDQPVAFFVSRWFEDRRDFFVYNTARRYKPESNKGGTLMQKIKRRHTENDRIICERGPERCTFYYQSAGSGRATTLFVTRARYDTVYDYFRSRGRLHGDQGFYLTIRDLYRFRDYHNVRLANVMERIPVMIDYVLRSCDCAADAAPAALRAAA